MAAYHADEAEKLLPPPRAHWTTSTRFPETLMFLSERGIRAPRELLEVAAAEANAERVEFPLLCLAIAEALAAEDDARLATAIDDAERGGVVAHAARMRIVLGQRNGDHAQLDRARPVLRRLGDRQFLRRLDEVASTERVAGPARHRRREPAAPAAPRAGEQRRRVRRATEA